jgi:L-alanine-DL-glutamate epimerase-like enolase superfamily enzyme
MAMDHAANLLVKITSSDGIIGWGEASPFHSITGETQSIDIAAAGELRELVMGKDPLEIEARLSDMGRFLPHTTTIRGAFDMALYDLAARAASMPLFRFLGGELREIETDITLYLGDPGEAAARAAQLVQDGFTSIKVKVGLDPVHDVEKVRAIRAAVGDAPGIRIDANQAWDRVTAVAMLNALERYAIEFCEQPCAASDHSALKHISARCSIPIMADESLFSPHDALALHNGDVVPYFNIKVSKSGGIHAARKIAHIAEAGGRLSMAGCMSESRLGVTAAAHFALAHPIIRFCDLDSFYEHAVDPIQGGVVARGGKLIVPEEPGIGATPDESYLAGSQVVP